MHCSLSFLLLAAMFSGLETSSQFTAIWYREVILGEVRDAAETYERIYARLTPWQDSTADERTVAALRAGMSFERLGRVDDAVRAYDWLCQRGAAASPAVTVAKARLEEIARAESSPSRTLPRDEVTRTDITLVRGALVDNTNMARQELNRGATELQELEMRLSELTRRVRSVRSLTERLERAGVAVPVGSRTLHFDSDPEEAATGSGAETGAFHERLARELELWQRLPGGSLANVVPAVADAFCASALRALAVGDFRTARRGFEQALALSGDHPVAREFLRTSSSWRISRSLSDLARRYLLEERLRQVGELQAKLRGHLSTARQNLPGSRPDIGVSSVVRAWRAAAWERPEIRRDAEIAHLLRELDQIYLALTAGLSSPQDEWLPREELRRLYRDRQIQVETARGLVHEIVDLTEAELALQTETVGSGGAGALGIVTRELQRLLVEGRNALRGGSAAGAEEAVTQSELLLTWFPGIDPDGHYRRRIALLRRELELAALQKELKSQE